MLIHVSTRSLPPELRRDAVADAYSAHVEGAIDFPAGAPIDVDMRMRQVADVSLAMVDTSPVQIHTPPARDDALYLGIAVSGAGVIDARGDPRQVNAGDVHVMLRDRNCMTVASEQSRILSIRIPNERVRHRLADPGDTGQLSRPRSVSEPIGRLLQSYALTLLGSERTFAPAEQAMLAGHMADLAVLLLGGKPDEARSATERGARAARRDAVMADIDAHVFDPDLSLEWLARRHQLSPSYIRSLFYDRGTTFTDVVTRARLDRAARMLRDPGQGHLTIAAVALSAGFSDISWFNRLFRRNHGVTPSEWRAADPRSAAQSPD